MNLDFAVIADYAAVTGDGKLVVAGIFDRLTANELPAVHASMSLAFRVEGEPGTATNHSVEVRFTGPDGADILQPFLGEIRMITVDASIPPGAQFVLALPGVRFERYGTHQVEIRVDGKLLRSVPLRVVAANPLPMTAM